MIYNVHSLIHLAEECLHHGPLDAFSAFPFESYLGKLTRMLRTTSAPLAQLSRRIFEHRSSAASVTERRAAHAPKPGFCYILDSGNIGRIDEICASSARVTVFTSPKDFFVSPLKSSTLKSFRVGYRSTQRTLALSTFSKNCQCVLLKYKSDSVAVPVLHQQ